MRDHNTFVRMGVADVERVKNDLYTTDPIAVKTLLSKVKFDNNIVEPCCGYGDISKTLQENGYNVFSSDLIEYDKFKANLVKDIFELERTDIPFKRFDLITNPPYKNSLEFVKRCLGLINNGDKMAMLLKITFLEGMERNVFFKQHPPKDVLVFSSRINCYGVGWRCTKNSAVCYAWFIWQKGYKGLPVIDWLNIKELKD